MKNLLKQILIGTTVVVFTACGGSGGNTSDGNTTAGTITNGSNTNGSSVKKMKKMTTLKGDGTEFTVSEYIYNTNDLVQKNVVTIYRGNSEQGDLISKKVSEYTYEKTYNMVKKVSKTYDANNKLISNSILSKIYNGDKVTTSKVKNEDIMNPEKNIISEGNFTNYVGLLATKITLDIKKGKLYSHNEVMIKVVKNKESKITKTGTSTDKGIKNISTETIERTFDSLDRVINSKVESSSIRTPVKTTSIYYDNDKSKIEPKYKCFGGYVKMEKNNRNKYPKSENTCYLRAGKKTNTEVSTSLVTYKNIFSNGLVIERKIKENNIITMIYTYEYE